MSGFFNRCGRFVIPAALGALVLAGGAFSATANSLKITGPKTIKVDAKFSLKFSGYAGGQANFVRVHFDVPCAATEKAQKGKVLNFGPLTENKSFSIPFPGGGPNEPLSTAGKHTVCAFLVGGSKTFAHASFSWSAG